MKNVADAMKKKDIYADLHTHTQCSDGTYAPSELVRRAAERGIRAVAVTDHDTVRGLAEAAEAAKKHGLRFVQGAELSVTVAGDEIHLLGYGFDPHHSGLQRRLQAMQEARRERVWRIVERLRSEGIELSDELVISEISDSHAAGRPHVAAALVQAGRVGTADEAFDRYLGRDRPGFVPKPPFPVEEALSILHDAGGIGVLAHPGHWTASSQIRRLVDLGLDGLETVHPSHDSSLRQYYDRLAKGYGLVQTGGSDSHGPRSGKRDLLGNVGMNQAQWERFLSAVA